jgi:hypothetical protein
LQNEPEYCLPLVEPSTLVDESILLDSHILAEDTLHGSSKQVIGEIAFERDEIKSRRRME